MTNLLPPYVATYSTRTPYVTEAEFMNTPTGVDVENLLADGSALTETQTLANILLRASGWADSICSQILCATVDTRVGKFRLRPDYSIAVPLPFWPVINITGISLGFYPSAMQDVADWSNLWPGSDGILEIPMIGIPTVGQQPPGMYRVYLGDDVYTKVTYVNGWANSAFTGAVTAGATSLPVANALGIAPGQQLAVYSQTAGEVVTVASTWTAPTVPGPGSVPVTSGLLNAYALGDTVTAMPQEIKQAVILLAACLVKSRAADALEMGELSTTPHTITRNEGLDEYEEAHDLLTAYRRVGY